MLIEIKTQISGTRNWEPWPASGAILDLPEGEARDLIACGYAIAASAPVEVEAPKPETKRAPRATKR